MESLKKISLSSSTHPTRINIKTVKTNLKPNCVNSLYLVLA